MLLACSNQDITFNNITLVQYNMTLVHSWKTKSLTAYNTYLKTQSFM